MIIPVTDSMRDAGRLKDLVSAVRAGVEDGTLDCVVRGEAAECPDICTKAHQMCAGCWIRVVAGVPRRPDDAALCAEGEA